MSTEAVAASFLSWCDAAGIERDGLAIVGDAALRQRWAGHRHTSGDTEADTRDGAHGAHGVHGSHGAHRSALFLSPRGPRVGVIILLFFLFFKT